MTTLREAAQQALEALEGGADSWQLIGPAIDALRAALAEPVQKPPEFPPHDDKVHAGAIYWYVGTDGKYYSSNEVKLFMETKNKSLHYEPPKWVLDNFDLIPLYTAPPQRKPLTEEEIAELGWQEQLLLVCDGLDELTEIARAVERAHGIGGQL